MCSLGSMWPQGQTCECGKPATATWGQPGLADVYVCDDHDPTRCTGGAMPFGFRYCRMPGPSVMNAATGYPAPQWLAADCQPRTLPGLSRFSEPWQDCGMSSLLRGHAKPSPVGGT